MILSVDPGLRGIGAALFAPDTGKLLYAAYLRNPETSGDGAKAWFALADHCYEVLKAKAKELQRPIDVYVVELMMRRYKDIRTDVNDLIQVAAAGAAVGAALPVKAAYSYPASTWKGSVPKKIHNVRILNALSPEERAIYDAEPTASSLKHNIVDAIGIGLYHLERMRVRV